MPAQPFLRKRREPASVKVAWRIILPILVFSIAGSIPSFADAPGDPQAVAENGGLWTAKDGSPTYRITKDGTVDWGTFIGYLRYNDTCMRCHGPDGEGSSYAPALVSSLKNINYSQFIADVAAGVKSVNTAQQLVMPAFANDKNVMCFITEIYSYLRARSTDALGRGRPQKNDPSPAGFDDASYKCLGIPQ
jgi:methanol metabolism-related c-type cytochrome